MARSPAAPRNNGRAHGTAKRLVCALILALAGATAEQIADDYMMTYYNYYGVTKEGSPARYEAVLRALRSVSWNRRAGWNSGN